MLVFVHINKTAGTTVRNILRSSFGTRHCSVEPWHSQWADDPFSTDDLRRLRRLYPRLESIAGHRVTGHVDLRPDDSTLIYFTFVRDPLAACASRFQFTIDHRGKERAFEDWIQQDFVRNYQTKRIGGTADVDSAVRTIRERNMFVGLTDRFDESIVMFKDLRASNVNISYERANVAQSNALAQSLLADQRSRELMIDANQADIALVDYLRNELFEDQLSAYGPSLSDAVAAHRAGNTGFNKRRIFASRMKHKVAYKPAIWLYRRLRANRNPIGD